MPVENGELPLVELVNKDADSLRLRFNYQFYDDDGVRSVYPGIEVSYPFNGPLSGYVSPEQFVLRLASDVPSVNAVNSFDWNNFFESGRDMESEAAKNLSFVFRDLCKSVQNEVFRNHEPFIESDVVDQRPTVPLMEISPEQLAVLDEKAVLVAVADPDKEAPQLVEFLDQGEDGARFRLNYRKDGRYLEGVTLSFPDVVKSEDCQGVLYRLDAMLQADDYQLSDAVAFYCENRSDPSLAEKSENALHLVRSTSLDSVSYYLDGQERRHQFDEELKPASRLVDVSLHGDKCSVTFNYRSDRDTVWKGRSVSFSAPDWLKEPEGLARFQEQLESVYADEKKSSLQASVRNWMDGSDRKDAERKELKSDEGLGYFESLMRDRSKALDESMLSFTEDVRKTMEYEADYSRMTQRYGTRDHFIDVLKSDDDSVTLRFNFSRYDSEGKRTEAINKGVVYTMPWYGADSVSLGQKARFLSFLEERFAADRNLQDRIRSYNMSRFHDGELADSDIDKIVNYRLDDKDRSRTMAYMLRQFVMDAKFDLPKVRLKEVEEEETKLRSFRERVDACSKALFEKKFEMKSLGIWGRFKLRVFHHKKWKQHKLEEAALEKQLKLADLEMKQFVRPVGRSDELLAVLRDVHVTSHKDIFSESFADEKMDVRQRPKNEKEKDSVAVEVQMPSVSKNRDKGLSM